LDNKPKRSIKTKDVEEKGSLQQKKCTGANNKGGNEKKKVYIEVEDNMQRKNKGGVCLEN